MTPLLQFVDVSFSYEQRRVLENVSFCVEAGECGALIGPNGVGKTTLLRLAAGALACSRGTVSLAGRGLHTLGRGEAARLVALVPQRFEVPFDFTVEQIVEQGRTPYLGLFAGFKCRDRLDGAFFHHAEITERDLSPGGPVIELDGATRLPFFSDVIPVPPIGRVYSPGDLLLATGGFVLPFAASRRK